MLRIGKLTSEFGQWVHGQMPLFLLLVGGSMHQWCTVLVVYSVIGLGSSWTAVSMMSCYGATLAGLSLLHLSLTV